VAYKICFTIELKGTESGRIWDPNIRQRGMT